MNASRRRILGLAAAIIVLAGVTAYCSWRAAVMSHRGWAGFSYVPPVSSKRAQASESLAGLTAGGVLMVFPGSPAERSGLQRSDTVVAVNGIPARDFKRIMTLSDVTKRGDVLRYRLSRNGVERDVLVRFDSPLHSPTFAATFTASLIVGLAFLLIGVFVFWRRPADARATVFFVMTLVASVAISCSSLIQVDGSNLRGLLGGRQALGEFGRMMVIAGTAVFFAPLLLHLSLIFPKERPVLQRRPATFKWIYGYPAALWVVAIGSAGAGGLIAATQNLRFVTSRNVTITLVVIAASCLASIIVKIVRWGPREGLLRSPYATILLTFDIAGAIITAGFAATTRMHSPIGVFVATFTVVILGALSACTYPVATVIALFRSYRESGVEERRQVKWPVWGTIVAVGGKIILALIGFTLVFMITFRQAQWPPILLSLPDVGSKVLYLLIPVSFAFAILKYRLMNIDVIIRRTVLYTILSAVVFILYAGLVAGLGTVLVHFAGMKNQTMVIASTIVVALVAVPLRNGLQRMVDRNLFREKRDYPLALRKIAGALTASAGVGEFLRRCAEELQQALQNRMVLIAMRRNGDYVATAKVGVPDEVLGSVSVPAQFDDRTIPDALRRLGTTLIVPVRAHREAVALLALGSKLSDEDFSAEDGEFLNSAASQIAVGIENLRLRDEEVEFEQARAMQQILLPRHFPQLDGFSITGMWHPARSVGGDYFDTLALGGGKAAVCIGDVAGKGMAAALLMANLQAAVKAVASADAAPSMVCERVKSIVSGNLAGGKFISFFYGSIDAIGRTFTYSNAGHNPPILVTASNEVRRLDRGGPAICRLFRDMPHAQETVPVGPGDRIVLFTDGASEARRGEEEFGDDRLIEIILEHRRLGAAELQQKIFETLGRFTAGDFGDDVTLVVVAAD